METYDYNAHVAEDLRDNLEEWFDTHDINDYSDLDDLVTDITDFFFTEDCVTGNGSGSYTFSTWNAEENLCHNIDLLLEASKEFGFDLAEYIKKGPEACDVAIRCYILGQVAYDVIKEYVNENYPDFITSLTNNSENN